MTRDCIERALEHVDAAREVLQISRTSEAALLAAHSQIVRAGLELSTCSDASDDDVAVARAVIALTRDALNRALTRIGGAR